MIRLHNMYKLWYYSLEQNSFGDVRSNLERNA